MTGPTPLSSTTSTSQSGVSFEATSSVQNLKNLFDKLNPEAARHSTRTVLFISLDSPSAQPTSAQSAPATVPPAAVKRAENPNTLLSKILHEIALNWSTFKNRTSEKLTPYTDQITLPTQVNIKWGRIVLAAMLLFVCFKSVQRGNMEFDMLIISLILGFSTIYVCTDR